MNVRTRAHVCLRACVCLYSYVSACMYSCAHVCVWLSRHACLPVLVLLCVPVHAYTPACVCYVYVYTCMQTSVYVCVSVCSHVCQASVYVYKNTLVSVHCDWLPALLLTSLPWKWGKSSHRNIFNLSKQQGEIQLSSPPWPEPLESLRVAAFDRQGTAMLPSRTQRHMAEQEAEAGISDTCAEGLGCTDAWRMGLHFLHRRCPHQPHLVPAVMPETRGPPLFQTFTV